MAGHGTTVQLNAADVAFLARRGGRSHRGGGDFARSVVLHRTLDTLRVLLADLDPLKTGRLSPDQHAVAIHHLPAPWQLRAFEIEHLDGILERAPGLPAALAAKGLPPQDFLAAIRALTFAEKVALVDHALQAQAPSASAATPEEP